MISKELLSEVLSEIIISLGFISKNTLMYQSADEHDDTINIYELAFRTREYLKTKSKHLSLNQSIDDIFKEANDIYESLSK